VKDKTPRRSQNLFISLSIIISLTISVTVAEWVLRYQRQSIEQEINSSERMEPGMILYDARLGWKLKPYWSGKHHHYDYDAFYNINSHGFRAPDVNDETVEYAVVGDSFSFGLGVEDDETFTALLNVGSEKNKTFYNYSVPGYSTDQQLLFINNIKADISNKIILMVYLGNDLFDNMRNYPLQAEHGKPHFQLNDNKLTLLNTPVPLTEKPAAARKDSITRIVLGNDSDATFSGWLARLEISRRLGLFEKKIVLTDETMDSRFSDSLNLFTALIYEIDKLIDQDQDENQGRLTVVLLPGRSYVEQPASLSAQYQEYFRKKIMQTLAASSIKVLDLATYLREQQDDGARDLFYPNEGHLTPLGHRHVADYLEASL